jgi:hypothetical protein
MRKVKLSPVSNNLRSLAKRGSASPDNNDTKDGFYLLKPRETINIQADSLPAAETKIDTKRHPDLRGEWIGAPVAHDLSQLLVA